jgi:hypothetical protein
MLLIHTYRLRPYSLSPHRLFSLHVMSRSLRNSSSLISPPRHELVLACQDDTDASEDAPQSSSSSAGRSRPTRLQSRAKVQINFFLILIFVCFKYKNQVLFYIVSYYALMSHLRLSVFAYFRVFRLLYLSLLYIPYNLKVL